jgi:D-threonate/D-erythronate kinase
LSPWLLALADDLTGALEVGAQFAAGGVESRVVVSASGPATLPCGDAPAVLVIDTETRHRPAAEAAAVVEAAVQAAVQAWPRTFTPPLLYKKTDSTLRGNIAAEFGALLRALPGRELVYVPAYPQLGRTVRGGHLYVDGVPVHRTPFARDPLNPVRESGIARLLEGLPVRVVDGETAADVAAAAQEIAAGRPAPIAAGPAALAGALAAYLPLARGVPPELPRVPCCLVVNGSLHPASAAQLVQARACGWQTAGPERMADALRTGGWWLLDGTAPAARTAEIVHQALRDAPSTALAVFGGDTAVAIHRALGAADFAPYGEVLPGVAVSRSGGRVWITKAGGFGAPDILCEMRKRLT